LKVAGCSLGSGFHGSAVDERPFLFDPIGAVVEKILQVGSGCVAGRGRFGVERGGDDEVERGAWSVEGRSGRSVER